MTDNLSVSSPRPVRRLGELRQNLPPAPHSGPPAAFLGSSPAPATPAPSFTPVPDQVLVVDASKPFPEAGFRPSKGVLLRLHLTLPDDDLRLVGLSQLFSRMRAVLAGEVVFLDGRRIDALGVAEATQVPYADYLQPGRPARQIVGVVRRGGTETCFYTLPEAARACGAHYAAFMVKYRKECASQGIDHTQPTPVGFLYKGHEVSVSGVDA